LPIPADELISAAEYNVDESLVSAIKSAVSALSGEEAIFGKSYLSIAEKALAKGDTQLICFIRMEQVMCM
jgi:hypothetical protein